MKKLRGDYIRAMLADKQSSACFLRMLLSYLTYSSTPKMEKTSSSETSLDFTNYNPADPTLKVRGGGG
jgi:hypothetical protein